MERAKQKSKKNKTKQHNPPSQKKETNKKNSMKLVEINQTLKFQRHNLFYPFSSFYISVFLGSPELIPGTFVNGILNSLLQTFRSAV